MLKRFLLPLLLCGLAALSVLTLPACASSGLNGAKCVPDPNYNPAQPKSITQVAENPLCPTGQMLVSTAPVDPDLVTGPDQEVYRIDDHRYFVMVQEYYKYKARDRWTTNSCEGSIYFIDSKNHIRSRTGTGMWFGLYAVDSEQYLALPSSGERYGHTAYSSDGGRTWVQSAGDSINNGRGIVGTPDFGMYVMGDKVAYVAKDSLAFVAPIPPPDQFYQFTGIHDYTEIVTSNTGILGDKALSDKEVEKRITQIRKTRSPSGQTQFKCDNKFIDNLRKAGKIP